MRDITPSTDPAAVLARSVLAGAESVLLTGAGPGGTVLDGTPLLLAGGRLGLRVPPRAPLAGARKAVAQGGAADVAVHVTALVPVPVRHRVRARVSVSGPLMPWDRLTLTGADAGLVGAALDAGDEVWVLDVRLPFSCPVASGEALRREMAGLLASAVDRPDRADPADRADWAAPDDRVL